jgi:hypothetical protein
MDIYLYKYMKGRILVKKTERFLKIKDFLTET